MKLLTLLIAAALCGQAQEKGTAGCVDLAGGRAVPCPPSIEERLERLEKRLQWLDALIDTERVNRKVDAVADKIRQPEELPGIRIWFDSNGNPINLPERSSSVTFREPSGVVRSLTREEANALLVALANAINEASAKRAVEEWGRERPVK